MGAESQISGSDVTATGTGDLPQGDLQIDLAKLVADVKLEWVKQKEDHVAAGSKPVERHRLVPETQHPQPTESADNSTAYHAQTSMKL